ncbi:FixH family protein [uncultured Maritimibacter sp.]|jgi:nitrogen fixation protein FixH|uniref:FixH family protein n=1 Tax=uncultured Maritimibacter sp. TaxID=991866 RepID=UPI000A44BC57|nr:FixH family protein [uncultured Maritimibacter sp.]
MSVVEQVDGGRKVTGWHVLAIFVGAFGVIIGVNIYMAVQAVSTFPGLETKNSYVASQQFDDDLARQRALGWRIEPQILGTQLSLMITDAGGQPVEVAEIGGILGRATHVLDDQEPVFNRSMTGAYVAEVGALDYGKWEMRLTAVAADGTGFRKLIEIYVPQN